MNNNLNTVAKDSEKELEKVKHELFEQSSTIEYALNDLEKVSTLLDFLIDEYSFCESKKPDPELLLNNRKLSSNDLLHHPTTKWCWDYDRIYYFMQIARDYISNSQEKMEKAIKYEGPKLNTMQN